MAGWAKKAYEETDYALLGDTYGFSIYHMGLEAFGYQKYFTMMAGEPGLVHVWMTAIIDQSENFFDTYLDAVGPYIVAVIMGDDYGTQRAPMISVKMFRELFKPYLARICKFIHGKNPYVKVLLHSCGAVKPFIPEFIDAGVDALNPVQTTAVSPGGITVSAAACTSIPASPSRAYSGGTTPSRHTSTYTLISFCLRGLIGIRPVFPERR